MATTVAVIAVASMGFPMLAGRVDWRRGATVIFACFMLFGATSIVAGIRGVEGDGVEPSPIPAYVPPLVVRPSPVSVVRYDP